jgi:sulfate-transporting ATPase
MTELIQLFILGLASGSLYALSALGIIVVHRSSGVINLANGAFAMISGFTFWGLTSEWGLPGGLAVVAAIALAAAVSMVAYFVAIRPLSGGSNLARIVATLAVYIILQSGVLLIFGPINKIPKSFLPTEAVSLGGIGIGIGLDRLIIIVVAVAVTAGLWAVYRFSRFGLATTAVAENPRALSALGHNIEVLRAVSWGVAGALGGIAGVLIAPITQLTPGVFILFLVPGLAAAIMGGMKSFPVTLVAGMLLGAAQVLVSRYVPFPGAKEAVPFLVIIVVLVAMGKALPTRNFVNERLPRVGSGHIYWRPILLAVVVVWIAAYYLFSTNLVIGTAVLAAVAIIGLSQVVITGYAGQLSLAQMTLAGLGSLIAAEASVVLGVPFVVAILIGAVAMIPIGLLVGLPAIRTRGTTLAIATLGFVTAANALVLSNSAINGGAFGLPVGSQDFFGISLDTLFNPLNYMVFAIASLILMGVLVANLRRGRAGRRLLALRSNERAASALGINVGAAKLYAFTLAASIAAVGGTLLMFRNSSVIPNGFDAFSSMTSVAFAVLGGVGYIGGAVMAGGFNTSALPTTFLSQVFTALDIETILNVVLPLIGGITLLLQIVLQPGGVVDAIVHGGPRKQQKLHEARSKERQAAEDRGETWVAQDPQPGIVARILGTGAAVRRRTAIRTRRELGAARLLQRTFRGSSLTVTDATVQYGTVKAVDGLSFSVQPGEVLSIIGPNGAGKTSVMDGITGFSKMSGEVLLGDQRIESWSPHRRARGGLVRSFQTLELLEDMTVLDNLKAAGDKQDFASYLLDLVHPNRGGLTAATSAAIDDFGLGPTLASFPTDLPYGDRRLVAIARAIAAEPSVLLLDEPAAGLSEGERTRVSGLITRMAHEWKIAVVLIEHDVELVRQVSDRVIALDFGRKIAEGSAHEVLSDPAVVAAYLGAELDDIVPVDTAALEAEVVR